MGLLATEFDEEEFKKGYSKVCYEDGLKDGEKRGTDNAKREIVLSSYKIGIPIETISIITGLSIDKIKELIKKS